MSNKRRDSEPIEVVWVGAADDDPFVGACASRFSIHIYDNVYEALAGFIVGQAGRTVVVNARAAGSVLDRFLHHLGELSSVTTAVLYGRVNGADRSANGSPSRMRRIWADGPDEMVELLGELSKGAAPVGETIKTAERVSEVPSARPEPVRETSGTSWPTRAPIETSPAPRRRAELSAGAPKKSPFEPASLTEDELRALLGPEARDER